MGEFSIKRAEFITSAVGVNGYPQPLGAEIALVGRSNVGKSSLLNSICNNYKLARVSSAPGKTRQVNFFNINGEFYLVDLPGYGFAKTGKRERESWGAIIEEYLKSGRLKHIFLLLDIRHEPSADDKIMFQWIIYYAIPYTIVATKADKIAKSKRKDSAKAVAKAVGASPYAIPFSIESGDGKAELIAMLGAISGDYKELNQ